MASSIRPPAIPAGTPDAQVQSLYRYLYQLTEQLNVELDNAGGNTVSVLERALASSTPPGKDAPKNVIETYNQLKALIIKTATEVEASTRKIVFDMTDEYRAQSEFGTYTEYLNNEISLGADGVVMEWSAENGITTPVGDFGEYQATSSVYMQLGIVQYNDDGTVEAGVVIGKDLQRVTVDGKELVRSGNIYCLLKADSLSFWQNGVKLSEYGLYDFFANKAYIGEVYTGLLDVSNDFGTKLVVRDDVIEAISENINITADKINAVANEIDLSANTTTVTAEKINAVADDIDLSGNDTINITAEKINAVADDIDLSGNDTINITAEKINAVASEIDLSANQTIDDLSGRVSAAELKITDAAIVSTVRSSDAYKEDLEGAEDNAVNWVKTQNYSTVTQTDDSIRIAVSETKEWVGDQNYTTTDWVKSQNYSTITQTTTSIQTAVTQVTETVDGQIETLSTEIEQTADQITLEVNKIAGGINLLKDSAKGASGTGFPLVGYDLAETIEAGETMTFTIWDAALGAGKTFWSLYDGSGVHRHTSLEYKGNGVYSATFTFNGNGNTSRVLLYAFPGDVSGVVSTVGKVKLERGSRSTSWTPSPLDPASEVIAGSTVVINEEKVEISTPKFEVNTNGAEFNIPSETEDGSQIVRIDSDGLHADVINGPVVQTHEGGVYFVGGSGDHAALQDVFDEINDRRLNGDVVIKLLGSVQGGTIRGVSGPGKVIIAPVNLLNTSDSKAWTNNSASVYSMGQTAGVTITPDAAGSNKYATYSLGHVGALGIIGQRLTLRCQMYCSPTDIPAYPRIVVYVGGKAVTTLVDNDIAAWDTISISFNIPADSLPEDEIQLLFYAATSYQTVAAGAHAYFRNPCLELGWSISSQNTLMNAAALGGITVEGCTAQICLHRTSILEDGDAFCVRAMNSNVALNRCTLHSVRGLSVWGGSGAVYNCYGSTDIRAAGGGAIEIYGCAPDGAKTGLVDVSNMQDIADTGDTPSAAPSTIEIKANTTGTYSDGAWWTSDAGIRQGRTTASGILRGAMWFDGVPTSGVSKITLRLRRVAGYGKGGDVKVRIYGTTAGKKSGNPMSGATSNYIEGSIGPDEVKTFDVTKLSATQVYSAYVVYIADSGVLDGKTYSTNFARFAGTGNEKNVPVLTVTTT